MDRFSLRLVSLILLLAAAGCTLTAPTPEQENLDQIVAATLAAVDTLEAMAPTATPVPTETQPAPELPTSTSTSEVSPTPMSDAEQIKAALIDHLDVAVDPTTITVSEIEDDLARGGLPGGYFVAAKVSDHWEIIFDGNGTPPCAVIEPYDFPIEWVPECMDQNGNGVVRSEVDQAPEIADLGSPTWTDAMDSRGRWYLVSTDNTRFTVENGALVMTALEPGFDEWGVAAGADQADFYIELTTRTGDQCSGLDRYGVIFRSPDPSRGYVFQISCDGRFRLYLWDGSEYTGFQNWLADDAIKSGPDRDNKLGVMVVGDDVSLYANDQLLGKYIMEDYDEGRFGLVVGASETDNFEVKVETARFWDLPVD
jgi:hypothetical protein